MVTIFSDQYGAFKISGVVFLTCSAVGHILASFCHLSYKELVVERTTCI